MMKVLRATQPGRLELCEVEKPALKEEQVLIQVKYSMVCSSDIKLIRGEFHGLSFPVVPGHEWSGIVVEAPEKYKHLIGRKAVADILFPCLKCEQCRKGRRNLCENLLEIGISLQGGYAEYIAVDVTNVIPIPDSIPLKHACIIEPLAVVYNAIQRVGGIKPAETVAILGSGAVGLLLASLAKLMGAAKILVTDYIEERLDIAKKLGATETLNVSDSSVIDECNCGRIFNPDIVFDATGNAEGFNAALEIVKPGGKIGYVGYSAHDKASIQPSQIMLKALNIYGVLSPTETWTEAVNIIENGMIDVDKLITHEFKLEEYATLMDYMSNRKNGIIRAAFKL
ncbi:L-gulonate 5-dehydrogenase/2-deoxy-scyllo-inosamine dehydrogenase [Anaerobacterium chartisolvens]|uniref:L-gulonate 5-dehydrogenase/2-deoxy-scyllo-inosamine dehydrogenase n=1 Tax=Anaerobacterium chartisolvens TaxID=1297424 RepID=A0A369AP28_9FIRM|nr:alcohol dehydrogenase catalytic domain-containing protein [Anaerobacterium chartisolvens]RCX11129.1 L-gulonate 5-dehydrogenase/2-deoxy-scyllo-inosamine dehydrogenase [Anaerobacterium chartisolvens]